MRMYSSLYLNNRWRISDTITQKSKSNNFKLKAGDIFKLGYIYNEAEEYFKDFTILTQEIQT